ncbi:hypothetical protein GCM10020295_81600 [Streptomyces cinereospinus]
MGASGLAPAAGTVVFVDGVPDKVPVARLHLLSWAELTEHGRGPAILPEVVPASACSIAYTSGTTGQSKGVVSPHLAGVTMAREAATAFDLTTNDRVYTCLPMFHGAAAVTAGLAAFYAGATFVLSPRFSASGFWEEIRTSGATQFNALGPLLPILLAQPPTAADRDHAVTRAFAAPAPPEILHRFEERFGVHIIEGYGQTEIKKTFSTIPATAARSAPSACPPPPPPSRSTTSTATKSRPAPSARSSTGPAARTSCSPPTSTTRPPPWTA